MNKSNEANVKKFELEGSIAHYPPLLSFKVDHMLLKIKPDLDSKILKDCEQQLLITADHHDLEEIRLDIAELNIKKVVSVPSGYPLDISNGKKNEENDTLIIRLGRKLPKGNSIKLNITYSAGYYSNRNGVKEIQTPRSGFHFLTRDENLSAKQAWTQGEMIESKYWFPCLDDPQVKFPREVQVTVPKGYIVISNGEGKQVDNNEITTWTWIEHKAVPAYLTSVVIGKFSKYEVTYHREEQDKHRKQADGIPLRSYWPEDSDGTLDYDPMLTYRDTPNMMRIFEDYFGTNYPYEKYSQVAVGDFDYGGMENASCTTLTKNLLHNRRASLDGLDYIRDIYTVAHELSHQWFGDLVTCRDWSHIWLHEGFATFCEALYWEKYWENKDRKRRDHEYNYKILQTADLYFAEAKTEYKRPVVTNVYKYPEELFDDHSYRKGGCVLHMLRRYIGDENFRKSLKLYLERYSFNAADTEILRGIFEEVSGRSLRQFFNQWLYKPGHPELEIEFSLEEKDGENERRLKIKIKQVQEDSNTLFEFPLDIIVLINDNSDKEPQTIEISQKVTEYSLGDIKKDAQIKWISIDPEFKVLMETKSLKIVEENENFKLKYMLTNQLEHANTVFERIRAARLLKDKKYLDKEIIDALQRVILRDDFYGVSIEAANTLGSYNDKSNYSMSNPAYEALKTCLNENDFSRLSPRVRRVVVSNIGGFERQDLLDRLAEVLRDESYFVESEAATAIGKCSKNIPSNNNAKKIEMIDKLKELANTTNTFQNLLAQGAINGLREFSKDTNEDIVDKIASFLIEKSRSTNDFNIRAAIASSLGKFLASKNEQTNERVFDCLIRLLKDKRQRVKINACTALADTDAKVSNPNIRVVRSIDNLISVAEHDLDGFVRRAAIDCLNIIREWINEWAEKPPKIDMKLRELEGIKGKHENAAAILTRNEDHEKRLEIKRRPILEY